MFKIAFVGLLRHFLLFHPLHFAFIIIIIIVILLIIIITTTTSNCQAAICVRFFF